MLCVSVWNVSCSVCPVYYVPPSLAGLRRRRPRDETHALITEAFGDRGKKEMFHGFVMSITRRVKIDPCQQNG